MNVKTKEVGLTGNLRTVSLSDLFQLITVAGKTGMLLITRDDQKREIYFMKGNIIYATSSGGEDELLGNLLLKRTRVSQPELERALNLQRLTNKRLGTVLMEMGALTKKDLMDCLRYQVEEIIYNLFSWNSGEFVFYQGRLPPADQVTIRLNTMNVIMEGTRRIDEWIQIRRTLPSDDVNLRVVKNPKTRSSTITITVDELQILPLIDGERTIREIVSKSPLTEFHTYKALCDLFTAGWVEAKEKKITDKRKKNLSEKLLLNVVIKLYSQSYQAVEKVASRKLGQGAKRILKRCFDTQKSLNPILTSLESSDNFMDFRGLEDTLHKMPQPIRFHKLMSGLNDLLLEFLRALEKTLGRNSTRQVISQIKKEMAPVVAQNREVAKEYELEEELLKTLKQGQRCF